MTDEEKQELLRQLRANQNPYTSLVNRDMGISSSPVDFGLSDQDKQAVGDYATNGIDYDKQARTAALNKIATSGNPYLDLMNGTFRDTGRVAAHPGEYLDSVIGAPVRSSIAQMQKGDFDIDPIGQMGKDPRNAPTNVDLAQNMRIQNPYLGAAVATGLDLTAQLPIGEIASVGKALPGVTGIIKDINTGEHIPWSQYEKYLDTDEGKKLLWHGTTKDAANSIAENQAITPQVGHVRSSTYGLDSEAPELPELAFMGDKPGYTRWAATKALGNDMENITAKDVSKHSGLVSVHPEEQSHDIYQLTKDENQPAGQVINKSTGRNDGPEEIPYSVEPGDNFSENYVTPKHLITDEDILRVQNKLLKPDDYEMALPGLKELLDGKASPKKFSSLKKMVGAEPVSSSQSIIDNIKTPEEAAALSPEARQQYLDALDEVHGPREKRAANMGFDPETYYHGTANADIHEFQPATTHMVVNDGKPGSYFTPNPESAGKEAWSKADSARDKLWSQKLDELEKQGIDDKTADQIANKILEQPTSGESVYPVKIRPDLAQRFSDWGVPSKSVKVENPGVRSVNAAFDPRFKDSNHLLAGKLGGGDLEDAAKVSRFQKVKDLLGMVDTPEKAAALTGEERQNYLNALNEQYGPRDQRAKDMGFGDKTWYHGTSVPIDQFSNDAKGISTGAQSAKKGFFFAQDPSTASDYADLAHEHGVIREGDNVTTRLNSDNHVEPEKLNYTDVDNARREWLDSRGRTQEFLDKQANKAENILQGWEKSRSGDPNQLKFGIQSRGYPVNQEGLNKFIDEMQQKIADRYQKFYGGYKPATQSDIDAAKQAYYKSYKDYHATNPNLARKTHDIYTETEDPEELALLNAAAKDGADVSNSGGQNVLPVRLKGNPDTIHVKNYAGQGYRDTTYADEMKAAEEAGKNAVLFKNTYDAADPHNKVRQNIASVFNPNQIRSTNAAFDPRFADSTHLLAGKLGSDDLEGAAKVTRFSKLKDLLNQVDTPEKAAALSPEARQQYLNALDEIHGPREQRAADMGYGKENWYHGSPNNFNEFKSGEELGKNSPNGQSKQIFFSNNPETASLYGEPQKFKTNKDYKTIEASPHDEDVSELYGDHANDDGLRINNLSMKNDMGDVTHKEDWLMSPDNKGIRSTNAAFDPRFKDSNHLLAGKLGGGDLEDAAKVSRFSKLKDLLGMVDTPEKAVALRGEERQAYLNALDEIHGPREQRAADMGFNPETYYHGTKSNFDSFSNDTLGAATGAKSAKKGHFFTDNPVVAENYGIYAPKTSLSEIEAQSLSHRLDELNDLQRGMWRDDVLKKIPNKEKYGVTETPEGHLSGDVDSLYHYVTREGSPPDADHARRLNDVYLKKVLPLQEEAEQIKSRLGDSTFNALEEDNPLGHGETIYPVKLKMNNSLVKENTGTYRQNPYTQLLNQASESGNDSVIMKNAMDDPLPSRPVEGGGRGTNAVVFNPNQIRSTNAAFDPRFADSDNLLAGQLGPSNLNGANLVAPAANILSPDLQKIAQIESSGGKNKNHETTQTGLNAGDTAGGATGLMPIMVKEILKKNPDLANKYPELASAAPDDITSILNNDPQMEAEVANAHWNRLNQVFGGDKARMAYAWRNGITGAKQASDVQVQEHPYVQKFLNGEPARFSRLKSILGN